MNMFLRAARAAILDRKAFTEAFFDDDAMADGALVVASVGAATYILVLMTVGGVISLFDVGTLFRIVIAEIASWLILGFATWFAATRLFQASSRPQTLVAMHGLAPLPLLLQAFGPPYSWVGLIWYLVIIVFATKEATELDYKFTSVSVLLGFVAAAIVRALLGVPFALLGGLLG